METINHLIEVISKFMDGTVFVGLAMLVEMFLRMVKTEKPVGIVHAISGFLKGVAMLFGKIAEMLDKILPQKLK